MIAPVLDRLLSIGSDPHRFVGPALPQAAPRRDRGPHPPDRVPLGLPLLAFRREGAALTPWAYVAGSIISLLVFARNNNFAFLRTAQFLLILIAPAAGAIMLGGLDASSSVVVWSFFAPLGAVAFDRPSRAWPWFAAFIATTLLVVVLSEVVRPEGADLPEGFVRTLDVLNIIAVSFVVTMLLVVFARGRETAQARVEALLTNVLPEEIAERLQADSHAIADDFDNASILFADVVDFTPLASRLEARDVVGLLDRLFTAFDELVDRYDVEKIKTIGDCYMVAAGVPPAAARPRTSAWRPRSRDARLRPHVPSGQRAPASDRD